jgi:hypothetical protein
MKCGTTALHNYLAEHPDLQGAPEKEVSFFDQNVNYQRGVAWYHSRFPLAFRWRPRPRLFESTPSYLYYDWVPQRLQAYCPTMKLIVVLRDPIARAYSHWNMFRQRARTGPTLESGHWDSRTRVPINAMMALPEFPEFHDCIRREIEAINSGSRNLDPGFVSRGVYHIQLRRFFECFPREQVLVLESRMLKTQPFETLNSVTRFVEVAPHMWKKQIELHLVGEYSEPMSQQSRALLSDFYRPHNERLFGLLGRDFPWG